MKVPNFFSNVGSASLKSAKTSNRSLHEYNSKWKCFGCCHVRTATVILGLWHLAVHVMGIFLYIVAHYIVPNYYCDFPTLPKVPNAKDSLAELTVRKIDINKSEAFLPSELRLFSKEHGIKLWLFLSLFSLVATICLVIGAMKKSSTLVLPFFFLQVFDLVFDISVITVYMMLSANMAEFFNQMYSPPFLQFLLHFGHYQRIIFTFAYMFVALFTKMYLMHVVYLCYNFLSNPSKYVRESNRLLQPTNEAANEQHIKMEQISVPT